MFELVERKMEVMKDLSKETKTINESVFKVLFENGAFRNDKKKLEIFKVLLAEEPSIEEALKSDEKKITLVKTNLGMFFLFKAMDDETKAKLKKDFHNSNNPHLKRWTGRLPKRLSR